MEIHDDRDIERILLKKLHTLGCWGTRHVSESNLPKGFPSHVKKRVMDIAEDLRKKGILIKRPSSHDYQWYLNWDSKREIEERIK
ncbi:MAG: hypothetical protein J4469_01075 [Candidatus Aenigmarchaeota archaeon]|nr:hypothetical protein [Candidatus Aenigmarchaeota archaeon]